MTLRWQNIVVDCHDPERLAGFWSQALDLPLHGPHDGEWWLEPGGDLPDILFLEVPEAKSVKNRVHLDLRPDDRRLRLSGCSPWGSSRGHRAARRQLGGAGGPGGQ